MKKKNLAILFLSLFFLNHSFAAPPENLGPGYICNLKKQQESHLLEVKVYLYNMDFDDDPTRYYAYMIVEDLTWLPIRTIARGDAKIFSSLGSLKAVIYGFKMNIGTNGDTLLCGDIPAFGQFYLDDSGLLSGTCSWYKKILRYRLPKD